MQDRTTDALKERLEALGVEFRYDIFLDQGEVRLRQGEDWAVYQKDPHQSIIKSWIAVNFTEAKGKKQVPMLWTDTHFNDAATAIMHENRVNPPWQWLVSLGEPGDGEIDHENWLIKLFDLEDNVYHRQVTRLITLGLITRACHINSGMAHRDVGFKHYAALVGDGDVGKSQVLANLLPEALSGLYGSVHVDMTSGTEILESFSQAWLIEACELKGGSYTKNSKIKQLFDSHTTDHYRKKYAKQAQKHLRQWQCVATTNDIQFLSDDTALANRFYPITIENPRSYTAITDFLNEHRDQIFAHAMADWAAGGRAVVNADAREYQRDIIGDFMSQDHRLQVMCDKLIFETDRDADTGLALHVGDWLLRANMSSKEERRSESGKVFTFTEIETALLDSCCFRGTDQVPRCTRNGKYLMLERTKKGSEPETPESRRDAAAALGVNMKMIQGLKVTK